MGHGAGGALFVALFIVFAACLVVHVAAKLALVLTPPHVRRLDGIRFLHRVSGIAAPVSLALAGAVFVWLS